jgi:hypothetical protein
MPSTLPCTSPYLQVCQDALEGVKAGLCEVLAGRHVIKTAGAATAAMQDEL